MPYEQEWDFYFSYVDDKPASFYLDMGLRQVAPIESMPLFFYVSVVMNNPKENGLSTNEESELLYEIEDALVDALKAKHHVIYVGRLTSNVTRDFYFYTSDTTLIDKTVSESLVKFPSYEFDFEVKDDSAWSYYLDFIYPAPRQVQSMLNRRVVENLTKGGDKLTKRREVNHWIYFSTEEARAKFIDAVQKANFTIEEATFESENALPYKLRISRADSAEHDAVDTYTLFLWDLAEELGGDYDGWETSIETD